MARVPTTTQVGGQTTIVPGGFRLISEAPLADPTAATRALGQMGEQIARTGNVVSRNLIADQEIENEAEVAAAQTEFSRQANEAFSAYSETRGRDAVDGFAGYADRVRSLQQSLLDGQANPRVRQLLAPRLAAATESMVAGGQRYRQEQLRVSQTQTFQAAASQAVANGVLFRQDPQRFGAAMLEGENAVRNRGRVEGWDPVVLDQRLAEYRGSFYSGTILAIAETDPLAAKRMFDQARSQMDVDTQLRVANALEGPVRQRQAVDIVGRVFDGAGADNSQAGVRARIFRAENPAGDERRNPASTASGPGQVTRGLWNSYAARLGFERDVEGRPPPANRNSLQAQEAIFDAVMLDAKQSIGRDLSAGEQYAVWFLGLGAAKAFIMAPRDADARALYRSVATEEITNKAFSTNGALLRPGMTVGQVLDAVASRVGGRGGERADRGAMLSQVVREAGSDPQLQAAAITEFNRRIGVLDAAQAGERADLSRRIDDTARVLQNGSEATIPEADIRRLLPREQADAVLDKLYTAQIAGQAFRSIQNATPTEVDAMRADLAEGKGPLSDLLRLRRGIRVENGAVVEADRAGDLAARQEVQRVVDDTIRRRNEQLRADPAQYVVVNDPAVREAAARAATNPSDPMAMAEYVTRTYLAQERLGVPEAQRRVLSRAQSETIAASLQQADPGAGSPDAPDGPALRMAGLRRQYGQAWPQVFDDLVRDGKLAPEYQVLANIPSAVGQSDFARMMTAARQAGGMNRLADALPQATRQEIDREAGTYAAPFMRTAAANGGERLGVMVQEQVKNLATFYALRGDSAATALQRATDRILNDKYEFAGTMRVPKVDSFGRPVGLQRVQAAQYEVMRDITPNTIADIGGNPDLTPEERRNISAAAAQTGRWVPNENDTGLVLMVPRRDGGYVPARWSNTAGDPTRPWRNPAGRVEIYYDRLPEPVIRGATPSGFDTMPALGRQPPGSPAGTTPPAVTPTEPPARPQQPGERRAPRQPQRWEAPQ